MTIILLSFIPVDDYYLLLSNCIFCHLAVFMPARIFRCLHIPPTL